MGKNLKFYLRIKNGLKLKQILIITLVILKKINSIKVLNMKKNQGHTRSIAVGLKYIFEKEDFDYVIPMDGDGEDRPE